MYTTIQRTARLSEPPYIPYTPPPSQDEPQPADA
jgi:hypothetical protein